MQNVPGGAEGFVEQLLRDTLDVPQQLDLMGTWPQTVWRREKQTVVNNQTVQHGLRRNQGVSEWEKIPPSSSAEV